MLVLPRNASSQTTFLHSPTTNSFCCLQKLLEDAENKRQYPANNGEHQFQERNQDTTSQNSYYYTDQEPNHICKNYDVMPTPLMSVSASSHHSL